jgi:hypothetical protein
MPVAITLCCASDLEGPPAAPTATVKSIDLAAYMDQAAIDYVLAVRALHAGSVIMTHAVR